MVTIGIAIPCYKGHIRHLGQLLDSITQQTRKPDEVVVSCSSSTDMDIPYDIKSYPFPLKIITINGKKNDAENRNIAAGLLTTDIITFVDADDIFHPRKLEIIEFIFSNDSSVGMLIHTCLMNDDHFSQLPEKLICHKGLTRHWSGCVAEYELPIKPPPRIMYSQPTVSRELFQDIKYLETQEHQGRNDAVYVGDIANKYSSKSCYIDLPLTRYAPSCTGGLPI